MSKQNRSIPFFLFIGGFEAWTNADYPTEP